MTTQKKQIETFLFSAAGVAVMFLIAVAIYVLAGAFKTRFDLPQEKHYTWSPGTKVILQKLDTPVEINYYRNGGILQTVLRKLVQ